MASKSRTKKGDLENEILLQCQLEAEKEKKRKEKEAEQRRLLDEQIRGSLIEQATLLLAKKPKNTEKNAKKQALEKKQKEIDEDGSDLPLGAEAISFPEEQKSSSYSDIWDDTADVGYVPIKAWDEELNAEKRSSRHAVNSNGWQVRGRQRPTSESHRESNSRTTSYGNRENRQDTRKRNRSKSFSKKVHEQPVWDYPNRHFNQYGVAEAPLPEVNVWEQRNKKAEEIEAMQPQSQYDEEAMIQRAMEMSRLQALEDEKRRKYLQDEQDLQIQYLMTASTDSLEDTTAQAENATEDSSSENAISENVTTADFFRPISTNNASKSSSRISSVTSLQEEEAMRYGGAKPKYKKITDRFGGWGTSSYNSGHSSFNSSRSKAGQHNRDENSKNSTSRVDHGSGRMSVSTHDTGTWDDVDCNPAAEKHSEKISKSWDDDFKQTKGPSGEISSGCWDDDIEYNERNVSHKQAVVKDILKEGSSNLQNANRNSTSHFETKELYNSSSYAPRKNSEDMRQDAVDDAEVEGYFDGTLSQATVTCSEDQEPEVSQKEESEAEVVEFLSVKNDLELDNVTQNEAEMLRKGLYEGSGTIVIDSPKEKIVNNDHAKRFMDLPEKLEFGCTVGKTSLGFKAEFENPSADISIPMNIMSIHDLEKKVPLQESQIADLPLPQGIYNEKQSEFEFFQDPKPFLENEASTINIPIPPGISSKLSTSETNNFFSYPTPTSSSLDSTLMREFPNTGEIGEQQITCENPETIMFLPENTNSNESYDSENMRNPLENYLTADSASLQNFLPGGISPFMVPSGLPMPINPMMTNPLLMQQLMMISNPFFAQQLHALQMCSLGLVAPPMFPCAMPIPNMMPGHPAMDAAFRQPQQYNPVPQPESTNIINSFFTSDSEGKNDSLPLQCPESWQLPRKSSASGLPPGLEVNNYSLPSEHRLSEIENQPLFDFINEKIDSSSNNEFTIPAPKPADIFCSQQQQPSEKQSSDVLQSKMPNAGNLYSSSEVYLNSSDSLKMAHRIESNNIADHHQTSTITKRAYNKEVENPSNGTGSAKQSMSIHPIQYDRLPKEPTQGTAPKRNEKLSLEDSYQNPSRPLSNTIEKPLVNGFESATVATANINLSSNWGETPSNFKKGPQSDGWGTLEAKPGKYNDWRDDIDGWEDDQPTKSSFQSSDKKAAPNNLQPYSQSQKGQSQKKYESSAGKRNFDNWS